MILIFPLSGTVPSQPGLASLLTRVLIIRAEGAGPKETNGREYGFECRPLVGVLFRSYLSTDVVLLPGPRGNRNKSGGYDRG